MITHFKKDIFLSFIIAIFMLHFVMSYLLGSSYNITRIFTFTLFVFYILWLILDNTTIELSKNNIYVLAFASIILLQAYISPYINSFVFDQQIILGMYFILMLFIIIISVNLKEHTRTFLLKRMLYGIYILHIVIFLVYFYELLNDKTIIDISKIYFSNIRFFNHITTLSLPILFLILFLQKNYFYKFISIILIVFSILCIIYTGARGSVISLSVSLLIIYFIANKKYYKFFLNILLIILLSIFTWYLLDNTVSVDVNTQENHLISFNSTHRYEMYFIITKYIFDLKYTIFASGFMHEIMTNIGFAFSHNIFLSVFLGFGTIGLIIFIVLCAKFFYNSIQTIIHNNNLINIMLLWSILSFFIHSLVSNIYITPMASILLVLILSVYIKSTYCKSVNKYIVYKYLLSIFLMFSLIYLIYTIRMLNFINNYDGDHYLSGFFLYLSPLTLI